MSLEVYFILRQTSTQPFWLRLAQCMHSIYFRFMQLLSNPMLIGFIFTAHAHGLAYRLCAILSD
jgi:hypothetical protein